MGKKCLYRKEGDLIVSCHFPDDECPKGWSTDPADLDKPKARKKVAKKRAVKKAE